MGIFDWLLKGLGFETEEKENKIVKKIKEKNEPNKVAGASYNFNNFSQNSKQEKVDNDDYAINNVSTQINQNVAMFSPSNMSDVQAIVDFTRKRLAAIVNLSAFDEEELEGVLKFLNGAMYAMRGKVQKLDGKIYLVAPEGTASVV